MKYVFLFFLYLNITLISSFHRSSRGLPTTFIPIVLSLSQIAGLSVLVKGFFIFDYYIILPIIIAFSFSPLDFLLAEFNRDLKKKELFY
jgi:lipid II:glycine glycyltransferase (peptidoglycan interpeptide bridge formation enzyme)